MNEAPERSVSGNADPAGTGQDWEAVPALAPAEVRSLFVVLTKALRAFQLYDENNPVYVRFVSALREAFEALWSEVDAIQVLVEEDRMTWFGEEVYRSESRSDSLAFLLYKDGIRDLTFLPGIEGPELERFLRVLRSARLLSQDGDDLLTTLWEEDLQFLRYSFVELGAELVELPDIGSDDPLEGVSAREVIEAEMAEGVGEGVEEGGVDEEERPALVSVEDFNPSLYFLDQHELERLRGELDAEMRRDVRGDVLAGLFDRIEEPGHRERQSEILGVFEALLPGLLSRGLLGPAAQILEELGRVLGQEGLLDDPRRREAEKILNEVSGSESVHELIRALEDGSITPGPMELGQFVRHLRPAALGVLIRAAEVVAHKELRPVLGEAARAVAEANPDAVLNLLSSPDAVVALGAVRLVGKLHLNNAVPALLRLFEHPDAPVRLAAVQAATELRVSAATSGLLGALQDEDREVRMAAARSLGELKFPRASRHFREILVGKDIRRADLTEKISFFESYGDMGDPEAAPFLGKMLHGRGLLGRKESSDIRACAALALGRLGTEEGRAALEKARDDQDAVVRNAVNKALKQGD